MAHYSVFYVPLAPLIPGTLLTEIGRRLWSMGMPFIEAPEFGDLPEDRYEFELCYGGMGIVFSEFGDPVPNKICDLSYPSCGYDVLHDAYDIWQDEDLKTPTHLRKFPCRNCGDMLGGTEIQSSEPYTFATSYLY